MTLQPGWEIMKHNKNIFAISLGAASFAAMVFVVSMMSVPNASETTYAGAVNMASSVETAAPIILASAHIPAAAPAKQTNMAAAETTRPQSIPVPCPIWILGQLTGYSKTTIQTADGAKPNPKLVPAGIWFMQKFAQAASKSL